MITFDYSSIGHLQIFRDRQSNSFSPVVTFQKARTDASSQVLVSAHRTKVEVWQLLTGELLQTLEGMTQPIKGLLLSSDRKLLFCRGVTEIYVWDLATSQMLHATGEGLDKHQGRITSMAYDETREKLYFGNARGSNECWNLKKQRWELGGFDCEFVKINGGRWVLVGSYLSHLKIWRLRDMQSIYRGDVLPDVSQSEVKHDFAISSLAVSHDGRTAYCGYHNGDVELWNTSHFESMGVLARPTEDTLEIEEGDPHIELAVESIALSPDEETIAIGYGTGLIQLYDLKTKTSLRTLWEHTTTVKNLVFTSDGKLLVSSALDGTIRLWGNPGALS